MNTRQKRFLSIFADLLALSFVPGALAVLRILWIILSGYDHADHFQDESLSGVFAGLPFLLAGWLTFCLLKDVAGGRSIGKRLLGLQIVAAQNGLSPHPLKLVLRNLTLFLFPLEILMLFCKGHRRLGDLLADTKVVAAGKGQLWRFGVTAYLGAALTALIPGVILFIFWVPDFGKSQALSPEARDTEKGRAIAEMLQQQYPEQLNRCEVEVYKRSAQGRSPLVRIYIRTDNPELGLAHEQDHILAFRARAICDSLLRDSVYDGFLDFRFAVSGYQRRYKHHFRRQ